MLKNSTNNKVIKKFQTISWSIFENYGVSYYAAGDSAHPRPIGSDTDRYSTHKCRGQTSQRDTVEKWERWYRVESRFQTDISLILIPQPEKYLWLTLTPS